MFTERLQRVLYEASEEARRLQAPELAPGHLFLAHLNQVQGVAAAILDRCGVDSPALRAALLAALPGTSVHTPRHLKVPPSPETDAVLRCAEAEAAGMRHRETGGEHLLLALLQAPVERYEPILQQHRLTLEAARRELLHLLPVRRGD